MRGVCKCGCFNRRIKGLKCDRGGPNERCLQVRLLQLADERPEVR